jgi:PHD/YefM family antitoxin component YafN of YafNO toxin-antitoxin module
MVVTANEVKKRGVSLFDELLAKFDEIIISSRGKKKYIVMDIKRYEEFRAYELDKAYKEVMEDVKRGDYRVVSAQEHIESLKEDLDV